MVYFFRATNKEAFEWDFPQISPSNILVSLCSRCCVFIYLFFICMSSLPFINLRRYKVYVFCSWNHHSILRIFHNRVGIQEVVLSVCSVHPLRCVYGLELECVSGIISCLCRLSQSLLLDFFSFLFLLF